MFWCVRRWLGGTCMPYRQELAGVPHHPDYTRAQLDASTPPAFCGVYDFIDARFVAVFSGASDDVLDAVAKLPHAFVPLASNCIWARCAHNHALDAFLRRSQARVACVRWYARVARLTLRASSLHLAAATQATPAAACLVHLQLSRRMASA